MHWSDITAGLTGAAAFFAVIAGIWKGVPAMIKALRKLGRLVDDLAGEPPQNGKPGRPGIVERVEQTSQVAQKAVDLATEAAASSAQTATKIDDLTPRLERIEQQLRPNGGSTVADVINRIATTVGTDPGPPAQAPADSNGSTT